MSASLRKFRALVYDYSDGGTAGEMAAVYALNASTQPDSAWWCAKAQPSGDEFTVGMKPEHRLDVVLEFAAHAPVTDNSAVLVDGTAYLVRSIMRRDYGRDELQVLAERAVEELTLEIPDFVPADPDETDPVPDEPVEPDDPDPVPPDDPAAPINLPGTAAFPQNAAGVAMVLGDDGVLTGAPIDFSYATVPAVTGTTYQVDSLAEWQALPTLVDGDCVEFTASFASMTGSIHIPLKTTGGWVTLRTDAYASLPAYNPDYLTAGVADRADPVTHAAHLRMIEVDANNIPHFTFAAGTSGWWMTGLGGKLASGRFNQAAAVEWKKLGTQSTEAEMPSRFVMDRCAFDGTNIRRGVNMSGQQGLFCHNSMQGFDDYQTNDSQAFWCLQGGAHILGFNNDAGATSEIVGAGGATATIPNFIPHDVAFIRNLLEKPVSFDAKPELKNIFELKVGRRWLVFGNLVKHYRTGAQFYVWVLTPTNQSGPDTHATIEDVNIIANKVEDANGGIVVISAQGSSATVNAGMRRVRLVHNYHETAGTGTSSRIMLGCGGGATQNRDVPDVTIEHNTFPCTETMFTLDNTLVQRAAQWLRFSYQNNAYTSPVRYGAVYSSIGVNAVALNAGLGASNWTVAGNLLAKTASSASLGATLLAAPHNNIEAAATALFEDPAALNFAVKAAYQDGGTDGLTPGADIAWVNSLTANLA